MLKLKTEVAGCVLVGAFVVGALPGGIIGHLISNSELAIPLGILIGGATTLSIALTTCCIDYTCCCTTADKEHKKLLPEQDDHKRSQTSFFRKEESPNLIAVPAIENTDVCVTLSRRHST